MKKATLFLVLAVLLIGKSFGQNRICSQSVKADFDKMTGDTTFRGKNFIVALKNAKQISIISTEYHKGDRDLFLSFKALSGISCVNENEKIYFLFTDNTRDWSYGRQSYNCKGNFMLMFGHTFGRILLDTLENKLIKSVRLEASSGTVDFDLTRAQALALQNQLICLDTFLKPD